MSDLRRWGETWEQCARRLHGGNEELEAALANARHALILWTDDPHGDLRSQAIAWADRALGASPPDSEPDEGAGGDSFADERVMGAYRQMVLDNAEGDTTAEPAEGAGLVCCGKTGGDPCFGCPEPQRQDAMLERREAMEALNDLVDAAQSDDDIGRDERLSVEDAVLRRRDIIRRALAKLADLSPICSAHAYMMRSRKGDVSQSSRCPFCEAARLRSESAVPESIQRLPGQWRAQAKAMEADGYPITTLQTIRQMAAGLDRKVGAG